MLDPTGIVEIDRLAGLPECTVEDYVGGVSAYVRQSGTLQRGPKKAGQIRLSNALARALALELERELPQIKGRVVTEERRVAGALRTAKADLSETHELDGLRLAVEIKPVNLAVGRAIWNRFGDIRTFAVNLHLKFPFAVIGGVLAIPTYEEASGTTSAVEETDEDEEQDSADEEDLDSESVLVGGRKSTVHLIRRAIERLVRAGGRKGEAEAAHLLEGIAVLVYDPAAGSVLPDLPEPGSGLRWEEFVDALVRSYRARFED